jgi:Spy/CpxP family protein refolding chaperone
MMNARKKFPLIALAVLSLTALVLFGTGTAAAQRQGKGCTDGEFGPGHRQEMMTAHLELSEEQAATIEGIREAGQKKNLELRKELMRLRTDLEAEMLKDEPSEKAALDLMETMNGLQGEMKANGLKTRLEVRKQLTPEQRDKMLVMKDRHPGHGGGGRHAKHGRGCEGDGPCSGKGHGGAHRQ